MLASPAAMPGVARALAEAADCRSASSERKPHRLLDNGGMLPLASLAPR